MLIPLVSLGQSSYTSYYENGNLKVTGEGFFEEIKWKISAKSGLTLRESPDIKSKKIAKIPYGTFVSIKSKTDLSNLIPKDKKIISIFAGSRSSETSILLPILIDFIKLMTNKFSDYLFVFHTTEENKSRTGKKECYKAFFE